MATDDGGANECLREVVGELASDIDGLIQLATWQLALAREMKLKVATLVCPSPAGRRRKKSPSQKGSRRRKR